MDVAASDIDPHDPQRGSRPHTNNTKEPMSRFYLTGAAERRIDYSTVLEDEMVFYTALLY
jgi:hypothetical protein